MFETFEPEAFSAEFQEFEQACAEDARSVEIWMGFGFSESDAFELAMNEPVKQETPVDELLAFFHA